MKLDKTSSLKSDSKRILNPHGSDETTKTFREVREA